MQTIKKVILVMICFVVLLTSFIQPVGAIDTPSTFSLSAANFPDFDPKKIPWQDQPDYIQNIAYMGMDLANFGSDATYSSLKVPFIMIRNTGSECAVFVGLNCAMGTHSTSYALRLCANPKFISANNSFCYSATFDTQTYERKTDWQRRTFTSWGDTGLVTYTAATTLTTVNGTFDFYFYGGNCIRLESATTVNYNLYESGGNIAVFYDNIAEGFQTGRFFYGMDHYNNTYAAYFQPPSASQIEAETQKGIWESIKSLPSQIADSISGLFDKLINYLLYFQDTKPEHVNPFADILTDVKSFFNEQMSDVGSFKNSLTSTLNNVVTYIETGSGVVNTFLTAVPILSAFITFFVVFSIVRKVIGR